MGTPTLGSVGHATRRVMKTIMTEKLGAVLNWAGQRGEKTGLVGYRHIVFGIAGYCNMYLCELTLQFVFL